MSFSLGIPPTRTSRAGSTWQFCARFSPRGVFLYQQLVLYDFLDILDRTSRAGSTWQKCARFSPRVFEFLPMLTRTSRAGSTKRFSPRVCKFWVEQNKLDYIYMPFPVPFPIFPSPSLALYLSCCVFLLCTSLKL